MKNKIKKEIEKRFLQIRGWKNWEEYDKIANSTELDKNVRKELINICINKTLKEEIKFLESCVKNINSIRKKLKQRIENIKDEIRNNTRS